MIAYALAGTGGLAILAAGWAYFERSQAADLRRDMAALELRLGACDARLGNLIEDKSDDEAVDRLADDDLRNVPPGWLMPEPGAGGVY